MTPIERGFGLNFIFRLREALGEYCGKVSAIELLLFKKK